MQNFDHVNELLGRVGKVRNRSVRAGIAWLILLLGSAILCRVPEAGAATMEQPSEAEVEPVATPDTTPRWRSPWYAGPEAAATPDVAAVSPSATPSAAKWLAEGERYLDAKDFAKALALFQRAAEGGNTDAMNQAGVIYRDGPRCRPGLRQSVAMVPRGR
jgi:TPR repeat protein